ncbi:MAG: PKD domain-containing protein [Bacteroidales bacterium]|nr:PKD domain-containing protein [Bacteroidales bacterium]
MKKIRVLLLALLTCVMVYASAQNLPAPAGDTATYPYWIEMMQDQSVNFYQVQSAFETYWKDRTITRGCGYKPFKRWEYNMKNGRINPDGSRKPADFNWNQYYSYMSKSAVSISGNWKSIGPVTFTSLGYKGLGRVNAIGFHPTDPNVFYIGAPAGGVWKTLDGGNSWNSTTDELPTLGVSSIVVSSSDANLVYIGSGDRDAGDAAGMGVLRSTNGGSTWELWNNGMGNKTVGRLIQHPTNASILFAATSGGIYKTTNAGTLWTLVQGGNFKDIVFKPANPAILYAISGSSFFKSTNSGDNFSVVTSGLEGGQRAVIAVTPGNPEYVYLLASSNDSGFKGLYRSTNGGTSFVKQSSTPNIMDWSCTGSGTGGQAWYDLEIAADPVNPEVIFTGGVNVWKSTNGGINWSITGHWYGGCGVAEVHADQHIFEINPLNNKLFVGNDGGVYSSANLGGTFIEHTNGLVITQAYKIGQNRNDSTNIIMGTQDNGTSSLISNVWQDTHGGDGMECIIDHINPSYSYASLYYGEIVRHFNNGGDYTVAKQGAFGITEDGDWVTPYILSENDATKMFIGYKNIWRGSNIRNVPTWTKISDNLGGNNSSNIRVVEQSPVNTNILYFARYDKKLFRTDNALDATPVWINLSSSLPSVSTTPSALEAHPFNAEIVYMAQNGYIFKSIDRGLSWTNISGTLPQVEFTSIACYNNANEGVYISSDIGVFYRDSSLSDWVFFSDGLPVDASVREIEIYYHPQNNEYDLIRAGTFGRGIWSSKVYRTTPVADFTANAFTIPLSGNVSFQDLSTGVPSTWQWTFEGGTPATSTAKNPTIAYNSAGTWDVSLTVTNSYGTSSKTMTDYITSSGSILPNVGFYSEKPAYCSGSTVRLYDTTLYNPLSWNWVFTPADVTYLESTSATSQNPVVKMNSNVPYTIKLTATNANGPASITKESYVAMGGFKLPFEEGFEEGFDIKGWEIVNPDFLVTWELADVEGNGSLKAARMPFITYNRMNERDELISPPINLTGYTNVYMDFKHAYVQRYAQKDSLIVYVSEDCGSAWTRIYANGPDGNGIFETAPNSDISFVPATADDWCGMGYGADCITLDLSPWTGKKDIKIKFQTYNRFGNNLYIDNIVMRSSPVGINQNSNQTELSAQPNPSDGRFVVKLNTIGEVRLFVTDIQGKSVYSQTLTGNGILTHEMNLNSLMPGIYMLRAETSIGTSFVKLLIQ